MKTSRFLAGVLVVLFSGLGILQADPNSPIPQWYHELFMADMLYYTGVRWTQDRPAEAVQDLKAAQAYVNLAISQGAGAWGTPLSQAISQALPIAEKALSMVHTPEPSPVVNKPAATYLRVRNQTMVTHTR